MQAGGLDAGVAAHYGDPNREQRLLAGYNGKPGTAVVDLSHRGVVTVTGPDRLSWLNTLSSQSLTALEPNVGTELLLLSIQGRIEYDAHVVDDGEVTWLIVETEEAAPLAAWLNSMRFMLRVEIAEASSEWAVLGSVAEVPEWASHLRWSDPWPHIGAGGYSYAAVPEDRHPGLERPWHEYLVPMAGLEAAVGVRPLAGVWAAEALRIAAGGPAAAPKPTTKPSRTNSTCCAPRCTWPRAATKARRPWPACTTWGTRRGGSSSCSWTAPSTPSPPPAATCWPGTARWAW